MKKGRGERLLDAGQNGEIVGRSFVDDAKAISRELVTKVSHKAAQIYVTFSDVAANNHSYYGQGGLIMGSRIAGAPEGKRRKTSPHQVSFEDFAKYEATPVTAKYNLESENGEIYKRTTMQLAHGSDKDIVMPDGGCSLSSQIIVRAATADRAALTWDDGDVSFGETADDPKNSLTRMPLLFQKVPQHFRLEVGHKIGIAVFRTFDIDHSDAGAPTSVDLGKVYGNKDQTCMYTGQVKEFSSDRKTFCHSINTFAGCSGAVVFLLDRNQPQDVRDFQGMAVGIHVGGLDDDNNIAFLL
jgi:hypothetical protein